MSGLPADDFDHETIKSATRAFDLVVVGNVVSQTSSLTTNGAFVFTDSELVISDVWKGRGPGLADGKEITVTSAGGTVLSGAYRISASIPGVASPVLGLTYLLFLKHLPESSSYKLVSPLGFDVTGPSIKPLNTQEIMPGARFAKQPTHFMEAMRPELPSSCAGLSHLSQGLIARWVGSTLPQAGVAHEAPNSYENPQTKHTQSCLRPPAAFSIAETGYSSLPSIAGFASPVPNVSGDSCWVTSSSRKAIPE